MGTSYEPMNRNRINAHHCNPGLPDRHATLPVVFSEKIAPRFQDRLTSNERLFGTWEGNILSASRGRKPLEYVTKRPGGLRPSARHPVRSPNPGRTLR